MFTEKEILLRLLSLFPFSQTVGTFSEELFLDGSLENILVKNSIRILRFPSLIIATRLI